MSFPLRRIEPRSGKNFFLLWSRFLATAFLSAMDGSLWPTDLVTSYTRILIVVRGLYV